MGTVTQIIGDANPVIYVTCRAKKSMTVSVRAECCGMGAVFVSSYERCNNISLIASLGLNIVYVRPIDGLNDEVTVYIENINLTSNRTIRIQCIVEDDETPFSSEILAMFNATIKYGKSYFYNNNV